MLTEQNIHLTVFKGGTAFNSCLKDFQQQFPNTAYVVPITDDGGSSREILRVFGGPGIGDLRATLTRLSDESSEEAFAVKKLLEYRLNPHSSSQALLEWHALLENTHPLYQGISPRYGELLRYFLRRFDEARLRQIHDQLNLQNGSVGNFFFSGARMALGSLEAAIFLYTSLARIPPSTEVFPIVDSNETLGIGVKLIDGTSIIGQNAISHPCASNPISKQQSASLASPIQQLFYVDKFNNSVTPKPHPEIIKRLIASSGIIYGMGSLWTSIIPLLCLKGIGEAIAFKAIPKILILNCCNDRETGGMKGENYVQSITSSLNRYSQLSNSPKDYITDLIIIENSSISIDLCWLKKSGIHVHQVQANHKDSYPMDGISHPTYSSKDLVHSITQILHQTN